MGAQCPVFELCRSSVYLSLSPIGKVLGKLKTKLAFVEFSVPLISYKGYQTYQKSLIAINCLYC